MWKNVGSTIEKNNKLLAEQSQLKKCIGVTAIFQNYISETKDSIIFVEIVGMVNEKQNMKEVFDLVVW